MNNNRNWLIECVIVAVIVVLAVGAICVIYCVAHDPCDYCAYRVADWVWVLLQYGMAGAFGGFLTYLARFHLQPYDDPPDDPAKKSDKPISLRPFIPRIVFVYCMGGVGGAYAILFFLAQSDKMAELKMDSAVILKNIVTGVVAGFLGFPLLLRISESAEGILGKAKAAGGEAGAKAAQRKTKALRKAADALAKKTADMQRLQYALQNALEVRDAIEAEKKDRTKKVDPARIQSALELLEDARRPLPENRLAAMLLANFYHHKKDYQKAAEIVTQTIDAIAPQALEGDEASRKIAVKDIADLRWNRANYYARLVQEGPEAQRDSFKEKMYADLEMSLNSWPENINDIDDPDDPDFGDLVKEDRFAKLIARFAKYKTPTTPKIDESTGS